MCVCMCLCLLPQFQVLPPVVTYYLIRRRNSQVWHQSHSPVPTSKRTFCLHQHHDVVMNHFSRWKSYSLQALLEVVNFVFSKSHGHVGSNSCVTNSASCWIHITELITVPFLWCVNWCNEICRSVIIIHVLLMLPRTAYCRHDWISTTASASNACITLSIYVPWSTMERNHFYAKSTL